MVSQIRFYVEGAPELREGFSGFLRVLQQQARQRRLGWAVVMCGSRTSAYDAFRLALRTDRDALNVLLVDAEGPMAGTPREHLSSLQGDRWDLADVDDEQCHLMTQAMEAWLIADPDALASYYGQGFQPEPFRGTPRSRRFPKPTLPPLWRTRRGTRKRGDTTRPVMHLLSWRG